MHRLAATAALVCTLAAGCVHGQARYGAYAAEGLVASLGAIIIAANPERSEPRMDDLDFHVDGVARGFGGLLIVTGATLFLTTIFTSGQDDADAPPPPLLVEEPVVAEPGVSARAVQLTRQARHAAFAGMCDAVRSLAPRVAAADEGYYRRVFRLDPAISTCL